MKKSEIKNLDKLWSELVRAKGKCEYDRCEKTTYLNPHHIFSRTNRTLRWDIDNGICLCSGHHILNTFSAHKAPLWFDNWLIKKRGEVWYDRLMLRASVISKNQDYNLIKIYLEQKLKEVEDED